MLFYCVVRGICLKLAPDKGPLVIALLLRSARYRTGIGRTDRVDIILKLLDGIHGVHAEKYRRRSTR